MAGLVTIGIPVFKRLDTLHKAVQSVALQEYPHIELIISDNGLNGSRVREIVDQWYARPYIFRQNSTSVNLPTHYHQILAAASGEYFVWLPDDDTISPNYISELVCILDQHPDVSIALARQEIVDRSGRVLGQSSDQVPDFMTGEDFIRAWAMNGFGSYTSILARTSDIRRCGGYPNFSGGTCVDDALVIKLCLGRWVASGKKCFYRLGCEESSYGFSLPCERLAKDVNQFLKFLDSDDTLLSYARRHGNQWAELKQSIVEMTWKTYHYRWATMYRRRLSFPKWVRVAFALPFIPDYYKHVRETLVEELRAVVGRSVKETIPWAYKFYQAVKRRMLRTF
jgi:glycosyltransferase involved in cell wall biosynthesis